MLRLDLAPGRSGDLWFAELLVGGSPLRDLLRFDDPDDLRLDARGLGPAGENVSVLMHSWPVALPHEAEILLGTRPSPLPGGRVPLYVCSACGDLGCGAVTMAVDRGERTVTWRDAGWDVGPEPDDEPPIRFLGGPFTFDRAQHDAVLEEFVRTFDAVRAALPIDPAAPVPRRRRWWRPDLR